MSPTTTSGNPRFAGSWQTFPLMTKAEAERRLTLVRAYWVIAPRWHTNISAPTGRLVLRPPVVMVMCRHIKLLHITLHGQAHRALLRIVRILVGTVILQALQYLCIMFHKDTSHHS